MKLRFVLFLILSLIFAGLPAKGEKSIFDVPEVSKTMADIYAIENAAATQSSKRIKDDALRMYVVEYQMLMNYAVANNKENFSKFISASDDALDAADNHAYEDLLVSNLYLHRCMAELSKGNLITGGVQFWKSYRAFLRSEEKHKNNDAQLMLRGIFNILLSQIPQKWQGLAGFVGFGSGDLTLGFAQIDQYRKKVEAVQGLNQEALLISFANIFLSHQQNFTPALEAKLKENQSPVIVYAYLLSLGRQQRGNDAYDIVNSLSDSNIRKFPLLLHQKAKVSLRRLEMEKSIGYADAFAASYKGVNCMSDAFLMKAYAQLLLGHRAEALASAQRCAQMTYDNDVDHRNQADAQRFSTESVPLLRSRFCCEYGNYEQSIRELEGFDPDGSKLIEYNFRLGRANEKLGRKRIALAYYDKVIELAKRDDRYFGPYSAVYAADIHLADGNKLLARSYLEKAKKLNNGEYLKEITQRIQISSKMAE